MWGRRRFIKNTALSACMFPSLTSLSLLSERNYNDTCSRKLPAIGIQLYSVKEDMERDALGTLQKLGEMGYTQIESFGSDESMYWGMSPQAFKQVAADHNLTLISSHYDNDMEGFKRQADIAAGIGLMYLICPWKGPQKTIDAFKRYADEFNEKGEICKNRGFRFGYHPHWYAYRLVDGQLPIEVLLNNTDKALVDFQMDFYYAVTENHDPEAYLTNYKSRFTSCHLRDVLRERLPAGTDEESACDLGKGILDYKHLLSVGMDNGMKYFLVEQSRFFNTTPLQSAKVNLDYLKALYLEKSKHY